MNMMMMVVMNMGSEEEEEEEEEEDREEKRGNGRKMLIRCGGEARDSEAEEWVRRVVVEKGPAWECGEARERVQLHFARALQSNLNDDDDDDAAATLLSTTMRLNHMTPFLRFSHLTANQAILDSLGHHDLSLHILDLDIMHGLQWPPLMQALASRRPPLSLRISAASSSPLDLPCTGDRLSRFAHSLGLRFHFHPLPAAEPQPHMLLLSPGEPLAVNCVLCLHRFLGDPPALARVLHSLRGLRPRVLALAERQADFARFPEAVDHYAALFESLEATLPSSSAERLALEQKWLGREIRGAVARRLRAQRREAWEGVMRASGFRSVAQSEFAVAQAKLLLRLHYPSEGYKLLHNHSQHSFFLGWRDRPLYSLSSWAPTPTSTSTLP